MNDGKTLQDLKLKDTYSSQFDDLVSDFYNPILEVAIQYDRVTGFFSPKVLAAASRGFSSLIKNNGRVRLITSVEVDSELFDVISPDSSIIAKITSLEDWDIESIENQLVKDYLSVLAYLLEKNRLEIKIAVVKKDHGIFHQKTGIVTDSKGNKISFSGSNNETVYGWLYNIEKYYVFNNWSARTLSYFQSDLDEFENLWNGIDDRVKIVSLDGASKEKLIRKTKSFDDIGVVVKRITAVEKPSPTEKKNSLRDYQEEAIEHWKDNGYTSIFEMATGTGKTFTTVSALKKFKLDNGSLNAVVVVPLTTLTVQWENEINNVLNDCLVVNTSTSSNWRGKIDQLANLKMLGRNSDFIIITTYSMFNRSSFKERIANISDNLILVADEMHNLVTERGLNSAAASYYKFRLGLSATPDRLWRPLNNKKLENIFGKNRFSFTIKDAIDREYLVPYNYYPIKSPLSFDEYEEYLDLSKQIGRLYASGGDMVDDGEIDEDLKMKLMRRSRIKKNAELKTDLLKEYLVQLKKNGDLDHTLIYVENEEYLQNTQKVLSELNIVTSKIVGQTPLDDRLRIIDSLRTGSIDAIIAIKCLDEGVDIPSAKNAFILSNNTDPREYVQRLGRVLRLDPGSNKDHANVYDFIVTPPNNVLFRDDAENKIADTLVKGEMVRANFFVEYALNIEEAEKQLFEIADDYGFIYKKEDLCYNEDKEG